MTDPLERFRLAQNKLLSIAGLTARETREGRSRLAVCDATRAVDGHRDGCLLLLGEPGTGKSVAAARWVLTAGLSMRPWWGIDGADGFVWSYRGPRLLWRTAKSLSRVKQYDKDEMETLLCPDRLVIDDIGMEYLDTKGFLASLIDEIVHERHRRELPTVMTANLSPADFMERYGKRVVDRIAEYRAPVVCKRDSFRTSPAREAERTLPELAADEEIVARHAEILAEEAARAQKLREHWDADQKARDARVLPMRRPSPARPLAEEKAAEPEETPAQIAERENAARNAIQARLEEWKTRNAVATESP